MEIVYVRPPDDVRRHRQELLLDEPHLKITLLRRPGGAEERELADGVVLEPGARLLWFTFPGRRYEVAAVHDRQGRLLGHYTNLILPPDIEGDIWRITDLFLDVWQPAEGPVRVLDADEFEAAREESLISEATAREAAATCREIEDRARRGDWPPEPVRDWPLESVPSLRLRRDEPGTYYANKVAGRVIAFGIYFLGSASLTSLVFAAFTDALVAAGTARSAWTALLVAEAAGLLAVAMAGRLPATRWVRPREAMTESTLFLGAVVTALAVLLVQSSELWNVLVGSIYAALGFFLAVFAVCRLAFDRRTPGLALVGLAVCAAALVVLF